MRISAGSVAEFRLWQLLSPTLPIGAFAYSEGLEAAVQADTVRDADTACAWVGGLLDEAMGGLDLPYLAHLQAAAAAGDDATLARLDAELLARRESAELRAGDEHLGAALLRLLDGLEVPAARRWRARGPSSFALAMALAAVEWGIDRRSILCAYAWCWLENQITVAVKLVPLGQTEGQRSLLRLAPRIDAAVTRALACEEAAIGACTPGLAIASARHETQYSRLFRS